MADDPKRMIQQAMTEAVSAIAKVLTGLRAAQIDTCVTGTLEVAGAEIATLGVAAETAVLD